MRSRPSSPLAAIGAAALLLAASAAPAQEIAIAAKAGTTGLGGEATIGLTGSLNLRGGAAWFKTSRTRTEQQNTYEATADLSNAFAVVDFHPGGGGFRVSAGAYFNKSKVTAQSVGDTLIVNGIPYSVQDVGTLTGEVKGKSFCPYLGIGWGNTVGGGGAVKLVADVGVYYMGSPTVALTANAGSPGQVPPGFAEDLEKERQKIESDVSKYRFYPVVSIGISLRLF